VTKHASVGSTEPHPYHDDDSPNNSRHTDRYEKPIYKIHRANLSPAMDNDRAKEPFLIGAGQHAANLAAQKQQRMYNQG
jgi:hypothetical protein